MERKWEELQMDCLENIFEKLEIQDLTLGVPFVCTSWYKASLNPRCWKIIDLSKLNFGPNSPFAGNFNREYRTQKFSVAGLLKFAISRGHSSVLELYLPSTLALEDLINASNKCPNLEVLRLPMFLLDHKHFLTTLLTEEEMAKFQELIRKWKVLKYLHIKDSLCYTKEVLYEISRHCDNFVGIKKTGWVIDEEALAIVFFLPWLKHLTITSAFMTKGMLMLLLEGCKELEELIVKDCCGFVVDEEILRMSSHIKTFRYEDLRLEADERYFNPYDSDSSNTE